VFSICYFIVLHRKKLPIDRNASIEITCLQYRKYCAIIVRIDLLTYNCIRYAGQVRYSEKAGSPTSKSIVSCC